EGAGEGAGRIESLVSRSLNSPALAVPQFHTAGISSVTFPAGARVTMRIGSDEGRISGRRSCRREVRGRQSYRQVGISVGAGFTPAIYTGVAMYHIFPHSS